MTVKNTWAGGDTFYNTDANTIATQVNQNASDIATLQTSVNTTAPATYATITNDNLKAPLASPAITGTPTFASGIGAAQIPNGIINGATARQSQVVVSATNYYVTNSGLAVPASAKQGIVVGTRYRWRIAMDKTAAGTGVFQIGIYRGTGGSTSDTQDVLQTIGTQTAVVDNMVLDIEIVVTTSGATGAYYWTIVPNNKAVTATGFGVATGTGAYFSGTVSSVALNTASLIFGIGFKATTGTPTITVPLVQAQALNLM